MFWDCDWKDLEAFSWVYTKSIEFCQGASTKLFLGLKTFHRSRGFWDSIFNFMKCLRISNFSWCNQLIWGLLWLFTFKFTEVVLKLFYRYLCFRISASNFVESLLEFLLWFSGFQVVLSEFQKPPSDLGPIYRSRSL